jgi:hypothetical protein
MDKKAVVTGGMPPTEDASNQAAHGTRAASPRAQREAPAAMGAGDLAGARGNTYAGLGDDGSAKGCIQDLPTRNPDYPRRAETERRWLVL